jgi:hypothetical protein
MESVEGIERLEFVPRRRILACLVSTEARDVVGSERTTAETVMEWV